MANVNCQPDGVVRSVRPLDLHTDLLERKDWFVPRKQFYWHIEGNEGVAGLNHSDEEPRDRVLESGGRPCPLLERDRLETASIPAFNGLFGDSSACGGATLQQSRAKRG